MVTPSITPLTKPADAQKAAKVPFWQGVLAYFPNALMAVGEISKFGSAKHNAGKMPTKWRDYPIEIYGDALARHIAEECKGNLYDSESLMLHAGHAAWNALARFELLLAQHSLKQPPTGVKNDPPPAPPTGVKNDPTPAPPTGVKNDPTPSTPHTASCVCYQCKPDRRVAVSDRRQTNFGRWKMRRYGQRRKAK